MRQRLRWFGLVGVLVLVTAACDWSMVGLNAGRSGFNLFENGITSGNIANLHEQWNAAAGSATSAPVVAGGRVFVTTQPVGATPGELQEYDAQGGTPCVGSAPAACVPGWRYQMIATGTD